MFLRPSSGPPLPLGRVPGRPGVAPAVALLPVVAVPVVAPTAAPALAALAPAALLAVVLALVTGAARTGPGGGEEEKNGAVMYWVVLFLKGKEGLTIYRLWKLFMVVTFRADKLYLF